MLKKEFGFGGRGRKRETIWPSKKEKKKTNDNNNKDIKDDVNDRAVNEENAVIAQTNHEE